MDRDPRRAAGGGELVARSKPDVRLESALPESKSRGHLRPQAEGLLAEDVARDSLGRCKRPACNPGRPDERPKRSRPRRHISPLSQESAERSSAKQCKEVWHLHHLRMICGCSSGTSEPRRTISTVPKAAEVQSITSASTRKP